MVFSSKNITVTMMNGIALAKTMEMIGDDFHKFNEIMNENLKIETDIEKQLEKEDKKCTFLKNTVENLKKQQADAERISNEQRKCIFEKQMELEEISAAIFEQTESLKIGNPEEGLTYHSEMVNLVQKMIDHVRNFKVILQNDIDECIQRNVEIDHWKIQSKECLRRISEQQMVINKLREKVNERKNQSIERPLENITQCMQELQKNYQEYQNTRTLLTDIFTQKHSNLEEWKQQQSLEFQKMKEEWQKEFEQFLELNQLYSEKTLSMQTEITEVYETASKSFLEVQNLIRLVEEGLEKYNSAIEEKMSVINDLKKLENSLKYEKLEIKLNIDKLTENLSTLKMSNEMMKEQQELAQNTLNTTQLHSNEMERSITEYQIQLKNLTNDLSKLKNDNTFMMEQMAMMSEKNELLPLKEDKIKVQLESVLAENGPLEKELNYLRKEITDLQYFKTELKNKITVYNAEHEFLGVLSTQLFDKHRKTETEAYQKIEECIENVNELGNALIEKNLMLDALKSDVEKCRDLISSFQFKILAQTKENENKSSKLNRIKESVINEEKNLQSKINLLQDLEKNTYSRNHIPPEWIQNFEKHRAEYDQVKNQRLMLEEKRNKSSKLEVGAKHKKSDQKFSDLFENNDVKKPESALEAKNAAFKMFKERIMKKNKTTFR